MKDEKLIEFLIDDLETGGHTLGSDMEKWSDGDLVEFENLLRHWKFQVERVLGDRPESSRLRD